MPISRRGVSSPLLNVFARFPVGRRVPERQTDAIREIILSPYRIVYRLRGEVAEVVTVFRASRLFPDFIR